MMEGRSLKGVRKYLSQVTTNEALVPEMRVINQVVDLQLLKYSIKKEENYDEEIVGCIDTCIMGFIWLYENGGTYNTLPSIIQEDKEAEAYYNTCSEAWCKVQAYMRRNMYLMDE